VPLRPGGARNGEVCGNVIAVFAPFVKANRIGVLCSNDVFVLTERNPDTVLGADLACWPYDRLPPKPWPTVLDRPPLSSSKSAARSTPPRT
jgi:hypothetical protein